PLIPATLTLISPALSLTHWQALFADPQLPQALLRNCVKQIPLSGAILLFSIRKNCLTGSANPCNQECRKICRRYWLNRTQVG
ncbi:hypothetical protein, partial [Haemophilus influenzae]|uniref:hypothetical protein n=1 Tax=Haemophilus influenzae TaxID=727 RepID=UPI0018E29D0E